MKKRFKLASIIFASSIAALGTLPYGFRFAGLFVTSGLLFILLGAFFGMCATTANAALGTYSLLKLEDSFKKITSISQHTFLILLSTLGAIPVGFICFFGYQKILVTTINIPTCVIVTLVNSAINYTAINNLILSIKKSTFTLSVNELAFRILAAIVGMIVSIIFYLAAAHGLTDVFLYYHLDKDSAYNLGSILAIFTWLPEAALFANATQLVGKNLYEFLQEFLKRIKTLNMQDLIFIFIILASGSAVAQITIDFYSPANNIPVFFKSSFIQMLVYKFLLPSAFLSSAAVNYFVIKELFFSKKIKLQI